MPKEDDNSRSQSETTERSVGILTEGQREYLRGEKEFEHAQSERDMRYKIRERIKNALLDFEILTKHLEPRDREQLYKDVRPAPLRGDERVNADELPRRDELSGLVYATAFLHQSAEEIDMPFERLVELGVRETMTGGRFAPRAVNVEIEEETEIDYERIFDKMERDEPLTEFERMSAAALYADDRERYVELCKEADVDVKSKLEAGEPLTVGESCVLFALLAEEDYGKYDLREIVHDDVRSVFVPF